MSISHYLPIHVTSFLAVFAMTVLLGPILIPVLRRLKFGQTVRDDGPSSHLTKNGTPTIGGLLFLIPIVVAGAIYSRYDARVLPLVFVTGGFGLIGFIDDYIKVVKKRKDGLTPREKMFGLICISGIFSFYLIQVNLGTDIILPFFGMDRTIDLGWAYIPFTMLVLLSVTNSVNLTDGLDGLAAGVTFFVALFFAVVSMTYYDWEYVKIFSIFVCAGCLGFLLFNSNPAKVFMGDTGSLALGGAIGAISIVLKLPLILLVVGAIYVIEALSVILQVASYRLRRKRILKMAPIHHHFELSGWKETTVVYVFWGTTVLLAILSFFLLGVDFFF